jgi:hypothetical protein
VQPKRAVAHVRFLAPIRSKHPFNDETFIINGEVFKAHTFCFKVNKGDRVKFVEGSAMGACANAKFLNMRTGDVCEVWCE